MIKNYNFSYLSETEMLKVCGGGAKHIGNNIRYLRYANKITQYQLAKILHVTQSTIAHYENGTRIPDIDNLMDIARNLGADMNIMTSFHDDGMS
ncbi:MULTISPECIES: helix-turn-helix domain-containing protein [Leuconostoc]|uniref:HTH cro/C1-type domain-containing protein n=2 Tax=Leuconostoc kimchii TaxID=136609 RepID=D5T1T5_LEUKI|nr:MULTISPECIES: helix-turn-helix transcriptional regulator [Leuconostoc]ADG40234.1 hypothetical protein LKI_03460 [Leuconostoc kimchii IMSNU 11154]AEJ31826.1 hypothetical protein LGMK_08885 [Leuconostoc sp. C2]QBR46745.1 XRE family transcriptional regulator [Leuconostoc kimchii]